MRLIVGLGNPGEKYKNTRHNVGYMVVDKLKTLNPKLKGVVVAKTSVYMNTSGAAVKKLIENYKLKTENLIVVHDDLDIPLGQYKIQFGKGPKDHKGIESVDRALGTPDYWRVRIGIENRSKATGPDEPYFAEASRGRDYVLQDFKTSERTILDHAIKDLTNTLVV